MNIRSVADIGEIAGKKVIVRMDLNEPVSHGELQDEYRIKQELKTVNFLREKGARLVLVSHFENKESNSLEPVFKYIQTLFPVKAFIKEYPSEEAKATIDNLADGEVVLLENLRLNEGEKNNDQEFAKQIASYADLYVNEAFSASHREHASIVGIPKYIPGYAGFQLLKEIEQISKAFAPKHPFLFILGGAKFDTKMPLVQKYMYEADQVFIGGALANDLFKAKGWEVGKSVVSNSKMNFDKILESDKLLLPVDVVVETESGAREVKPADQVAPTDAIWDAGEKTVQTLADVARNAGMILWNGPLGLYEKGYTSGTYELAKAIAGTNAETIVGGGDTVASVESLNLMDKFTFVSTGGGAMLDFLANETLPGIEALKG